MTVLILWWDTITRGPARRRAARINRYPHARTPAVYVGRARVPRRLRRRPLSALGLTAYAQATLRLDGFGTFPGWHHPAAA